TRMKLLLVHEDQYERITSVLDATRGTRTLRRGSCGTDWISCPCLSVSYRSRCIGGHWSNVVGDGDWGSGPRSGDGRSIVVRTCPSSGPSSLELALPYFVRTKFLCEPDRGILYASWSSLPNHREIYPGSEHDCPTACRNCRPPLASLPHVQRLGHGPLGFFRDWGRLCVQRPARAGGIRGGLPWSGDGPDPVRKRRGVCHREGSAPVSRGTSGATVDCSRGDGENCGRRGPRHHRSAFSGCSSGSSGYSRVADVVSGRCHCRVSQSSPRP